MGLLNGLLGNAGEISFEEAQRESQHLLIEEEHIEKGFKTIRDLIIFTNLRLILIDKQGITGKKVDYKSIPYKRINMFSMETAGRFDLDAEMKIWVSGVSVPIQKEFKKGEGILDVQHLLSSYTL